MTMKLGAKKTSGQRRSSPTERRQRLLNEPKEESGCWSAQRGEQFRRIVLPSGPSSLTKYGKPRKEAPPACDGTKVSGSQAVGRNGHFSDTRPSSTAALIKAWGSVTPSEAIATIRWAILAFIAGVGREWSIRLTATSSADLIVVSNSGLKLAGVTVGIYSLPREKCGLAVEP